MTYLQFHAVFTLPWIVVLGALAFRARAAGRPVAGPHGATDRVAWLTLAAHIGVALLYTTPWDNYLVARGVWGYPEGRVWFTIGYVPIEEYLFFVLQTVFAGLALFAFRRRVERSGPAATEDGARVRLAAGTSGAVSRTEGVGAPGDVEPSTRGGSRMLRGVGAASFLATAGAGAILLGTAQGLYLGLILVWAAPVLALQWAFGGDLLVARWRSVVPAVLAPTLWLWLADRIAIELGIWWISDVYTTGLAPFGLPIEEAVFFLATTLLVAFGVTLVLEPRSWTRWSALRSAAARARGLGWRVVLGLWALSMVPVPLAPQAFPALAYVSTALLALGILLYARDRIGGRAWIAFAVAFAFGVAVEALGSRTGVPFGAYAYHAPGPAILGVPLLVPLGWWAFTVVSIAAAPSRRLILAAPAVLVVWDLGLDPLMVHHGFWRFDPVGPYAGVPVVNFVGWYVAGAVLVAILLRLAPALRDLHGGPLRGVFAAQAFFLVFGLAYFGLAVPAAVTFLAAAAVVLAWRLRASAPRWRRSVE